jgi:hypothetical protein
VNRHEPQAGARSVSGRKVFQEDEVAFVGLP